MIQKKSMTVIMAAFICMLVLGITAEAGSRLGGGIHYLRTVGEIKDIDGFDENAVGFMGSFLLTQSILRLEADIEYIPNYGIDKAMIQPQAYGMIGDMIYGGVGIGIGYIDGDFQTNPFYALRAGVDFFLAGLDLDVFASYRFQKANDLEAFGSDDLNSITFGALVRFGTK